MNVSVVLVSTWRNSYPHVEKNHEHVQLKETYYAHSQAHNFTWVSTKTCFSQTVQCCSTVFPVNLTLHVKMCRNLEVTCD